MRSGVCERTLVLAITLTAFAGIALAEQKNPAPKAPTPREAELAGAIVCDKAKTACKNAKDLKDMLRKKRSAKQPSQPPRETANHGEM